ncbi:MAG: UDP-N-acetylmuramate--L-alanine ligase [Waddliaceae bacterium]|nr:UDP-N-acetylmuramate--L-alanine ligase [Waddliaceae bacterium]
MKEHFHFIGIGGIGMSSLARILLEKGEHVSGSDLVETAISKNLVELGAEIFYSQSAEHIRENMIVVYSSAVKKENVEFLAAQSHGCTLYHRSELLGYLMKEKKALAVTGTHGKTSVSSLLAWVLNGDSSKTAFSVGGMILGIESNGANGTSPYFVAEADESDGSFLNYPAHGGIVTNIEAEHLDHYGNEGNLYRAMQTFIKNVENPELLFYCGDDPLLCEMVEKGFSYGCSEHCDVRLLKWRQKNWTLFFDLEFEGKTFEEIELHACGQHQVLNALGVFSMALRLGMKEELIRNRFKTFPGVKRRCERKGEVDGILVIDDYAHHPTEIQAILQAIRKSIPSRRMIALMQPHRYSRTAQCLGEYGSIFDAADKVYITDIYGAGESPITHLNSTLLVKEVEEEGKCPAEYLPYENLLAKFVNELQEGDVLITLGAGNITAFSDLLLKSLNQKIHEIGVS